MIPVTLQERETPPDDVWAKTVCKIGQQGDCCRYLLMGAGGWSCGKHSKLAVTLDFKALVLEDMSARSDNCEGRKFR